MPVIHIMSGIPGCGKSTYAKRTQRHWDTYLSRDVCRDNLRAALNSDEYFPCSAQEEWNYWMKHIAMGIVQTNGTGDIWIDQTTLGTGSAVKIVNGIKAELRAMKDYPYRDAYTYQFEVIDAPLDICIARNNLRFGRAKVPENTIRDMYEHRHINFDKVRRDTGVDVAVHEIIWNGEDW